MGIAMAIISSVVIFIFGQFILEFVIKPISEQRKLISEIGFELTYNSGKLYAHKGWEKMGDEEKDERKSLHNKFRYLASKLKPVSTSISLYGFLSLLKILLPIDDIISAEGRLIGLSNGVFDTQKQDEARGYQYKSADEVRKLLRINHKKSLK
ncbi:MAG: hypothetical protein U9R38_00160 [Candidatus Margulisiibacteriota bacterium]|nr:hypothetical protein [Candidatus Margulisiibacteriota bacterium]